MKTYLIISAALLLFTSCSKESPTEYRNIEKDDIVGTWNILSVKLNTNVRNINEFNDLMGSLLFQAGGTGQVWYMDNGVMEENMPMNLTWTTGPSDSISIIVENGREIINGKYVLATNLTITNQAGGNAIELTYSRQ